MNIMKRNFFLYLTILLSTSVWAYDFDVDGIYYNILEDGATVEVTYASTSYGSYSNNVSVPETVTHDNKEYSVVGVGESAFRKCYSLIDVTLPNSITYLGDYAFYMTASFFFKSIDLSNTSIRSLGKDCFFDCEYLLSIALPNTLEEVGDYCFELSFRIQTIDFSNTKITSLPKYAFSKCDYLATVVLPEALTELGDYCFDGCFTLSSINLPDNLETIGKYCFRKCSALFTIEFPSGLTTLGTHCFDQCTGLLTFDASRSVSLSSLPDYCFSGCSSLTTFTPPPTITSLGNWCFQDCTGLTSIDFSATTLTEMLIYCFDGCTSLTDVKMPTCLSRLEQHCFSGCTSLKEIDLSETEVVNYGSYTFSGCTSLEMVSTSPDNLSFGSYCFEDCSSLKAIDFAEYITYVAEGCFSGCTSLTEIELGTWVSIVYDKAFYNCSNIMSFTVLYGYSNPPTTRGTPFEGMNTDECILCVPYGEVSLYASTTNWKEFTNIKQYGEDYYNAIVAKTDSVSTRLEEVWAIITEYGLIDDFTSDYDYITEQISQILYLVEYRFVHSGLATTNGERYLTELDELLDMIEKMLATAKEKYEDTSGISSICATLDEDVQIYTLSGIRVDTPRKGDVYVVRYSNGIRRKILFK